MSAIRRIAPVLGACGLAAGVVLGLGGAAARPAGTWLGLPDFGPATLCVAAALALLASGRARQALVPSAGLLVPLALLVAGVPLAGVRAWSGPPLLALAFAGAAILLSGTGWRPGRLAFLPLVFTVMVLAAGREHVRVGPQGDEPHYLMVADSLLRDHDLALERDYAEGRYAAFHDAPLAPHYRVRGRHGEIYSLHAVGLSLLVLPAWALAGYAGVTVFMALLSTLVVREVREWTAALSGREAVADAAAWLFALSPPLLHYAGLVFTEVPAALALSYGLRRGRDERLSLAGAVAVGVAAAALPWLNVRYAPLSLLLLLQLAWRHRRWTLILPAAAPVLLSAVGVAVFHHALYGFWDPRRVYGRRPEMALATLGEGLPGLLLDQEFGLLVYAPVLVLAIPGLAFLLRRERRSGIVAVLAVGTVVLTAGAWHMWRGGYNPPGRFLVPIAPILAVAVGLTLERRGLSAGSALLVGWSLWTGIGGALEPQLVHRDRDGTAPFLRRMSGAREWTGLLPGFVLADPDRRRLAAVWAVALLGAVPWRERRLGARRVGLAGLSAVLAAQVAASSTHARTDDRDAVRLIGRPALAVPGWFLVRSVGAEWTSDCLGWGPLYEPHRHPLGAELGRRLPLGTGGYAVELEAERLSPGSEGAVLELTPDEPGTPAARVSPLRPGPRGLAGSFEVRLGESAVGLRLRGGGPMLLKAVHLRLQPSGRGPV